MKYNYTMNANDYKTPSELYNKALNYFGLYKFTLDACCSDFNIPSTWYYKKDGLYFKTELDQGIPVYIRNSNDGLTGDWFNYTWCNPPFNECKKWIEKAYQENESKNINIAMLLPVRTETRYWHDYILTNPKCHIEFLRKGYKFLNKDNEEMGIFKNALALVYFYSK